MYPAERMTTTMKPYWVYNENERPCSCCDPGHAMDKNMWDCSCTERKWLVVDEEPDMTKPHDAELCVGNCAFHPLLTKEVHALTHSELYQTTWGDYSAELEDAIRALETASQKAERLAKESAEAEAEVVKQKAILYEVYTRKMADEAMRGVKKGAGPKKYEKPCRWMVGKDALASRARGEAPCCWAWEYTDPKTNKRMTPHTCPFQHPGEPGWHNEWLTNNRFDPSTKQLNRFAVIADAASKKNRM